MGSLSPTYECGKSRGYSEKTVSQFVISNAYRLPGKPQSGL